MIINDQDSEKLKKLKEIKRFRNNSEAVTWLIQEGYKQITKEKEA